MKKEGKYTFLKKIGAVILAIIVFIGVIPLSEAVTFADYEDGDECPLCGCYIWDDYRCDKCGYCSEDGNSDCYERSHCGLCGACFGNGDADFCMESWVCYDCLESEGWHCEECGECFCNELDRDGITCGNCHKCVECVGDLCEYCGFCEECASQEGDVFHCVECGECIQGGAEFCDANEEEGGNSDHCIDCHVICEECGRCNFNEELEVCEFCGLCMECCIANAEDAGCDCGNYCIMDNTFEEHICDACGTCFDQMEQCENCGLCIECCEAESDCTDGMCIQDYEYDEHFCEDCGSCFHEAEQCESCDDNEGAQRCVDCCRMLAAAAGCDCGDWCVNDPGFENHLAKAHSGATPEEHTSAQPCSRYTFDSKYHWKECVYCDEPGHITGKTEHSFDKYGKCLTCSYRKDMPVFILAEPKDVSAKNSDPKGGFEKYEKKTFSVYAYATGTLSYEWYWGTDDGAAEKMRTNVFPCASNPALSKVTVAVPHNACMHDVWVYCIVKDSAGNKVESRKAHIHANHNYLAELVQDGTVHTLTLTGIGSVTWRESTGHMKICACHLIRGKKTAHKYGQSTFAGKTASGQEYLKQSCIECGHTVYYEKHDHYYDGSSDENIDLEQTNDLVHALKCMYPGCDHVCEEPHTLMTHVFGGYPAQLGGHGSFAFTCLDCGWTADLSAHDAEGNEIYWTTANYLCDTGDGVLSKHVFEKSETLSIDPYTSSNFRMTAGGKYTDKKVTGWTASYSWADSNGSTKSGDCTSQFTFTRNADCTWSVSMKSGSSVPGGAVIHFKANRTACTHTSGTKVINRKDPICNLTGYTGDTVCIECKKVIATGNPIDPIGKTHTGTLTYIAGTSTVGSCTTRGFEGYYRCSDCGQKVAGKSTGLVHKNTQLDSSSVVAATCFTDGYSGDYYCTDCGKRASKGHTIKAHHTDIQTVGKVSATETENGYSGDQVCQACGTLIAYGHSTPKLKSIDTVYIVFDAPKAGDTVEALGYPEVTYRTEQIRVRNTFWYRNGTEMAASDTFEDFKTYSAIFYIRAVSGFTLNKDTSVWVNGKMASVVGPISGKLFKVQVDFTPVHIIKEVRLNLDIPKDGDMILYPSATGRGELDSIESREEYEGYDYRMLQSRYYYTPLSAGLYHGPYEDYFQEGDKWVAALFLHPLDYFNGASEYFGYDFGDETRIYVNGSECEYKLVSNLFNGVRRRYFVYYEFTVRGAEDKTVPEVIDIKYDADKVPVVTSLVTGQQAWNGMKSAIISPYGDTYPEMAPEGWYISSTSGYTGFGEPGEYGELNNSTAKLEEGDPYHFSFDLCLNNPYYRWNDDQRFTFNGSEDDVIVSEYVDEDGYRHYMVSLQVVCRYQKDLQDAVVTGINDVTYTGAVQKPEPVVKYNGVKLVKDKDYQVSYKNNKDPGRAIVFLVGIGEYGGTIHRDFMICYKDVPTTHSYSKAVYWATDKGIAAGYSGDRAGIFGVGDSITRGQVVMFLWRAAKKPEPKGSTQSFKDVPVSSNFYKAIQWAYEQGIAAGYTGDRAGYFGPSDDCTRGQIITFLWRYAGKPKAVKAPQNFSDVPSTHNFYKQIMWAAENGITAGYSDGTFGVNKTCTRGHCVTFLYRMDQKGYLR